MATPTTLIPSVEYAIYANGGSVGGGTGGTLTITQGLNEAFHDQSANWMQRTTGARSWSLSADALALNAGGAVQTGHTPTKVVSVTVGGTALKGLTSVTAALSLATDEAVNSTVGLDTARTPNARALQLTVASDYYDPAGVGASGLDKVIDELLGVTSAGLAVVFSVAGVTMTATMRPATTTLNKTINERLKDGITLMSDGPVVLATSGVDAGLEALLESFFADGGAEPLTVLFGTTIPETTEFGGTAYATAITITAPFVGNVTVSATLDGTGPLTPALVPA
jgi:predicted secreted protein